MINEGLALLSMVRQSATASNRPLHLQVEPTSRCNLSCSFCSRLLTVKKGGDMPLEKFRDIFDAVRPRRTTWAGRGEPLLARDIVPMVAHAHQGGSQTVITTNFTTGKRLGPALVGAGLDHFRISIDAATPGTYESIRGGDFFEDILEGVRAVQDEKRRLGQRTPYLGFEFVMTQHNIREAPDLILLAKRYGVSRVSFRPLGLVGIEDKEEELIGSATYREFAETLSRTFALAREHKIRTNLSGVMRKLPFLWTRYRTDRPKEKLECAYLWLQVFVSCDGDVTPCCALFMDERVSLGNAFHGFHQAWNGQTYRDFRAAHVRNEVQYKTCWTCEAKTLSRTVKRAIFLRGSNGDVEA